MLKKNIQSAKIHFIDFIESDRTAADIHDIYAIKYNGESIYTRVIAFYTFDNNKITSIRELTQLIKGNPADDDMGSRF